VIDILKFRLGYGRQTVAWPDGPPRFPSRFRGRPSVDPARCAAGCSACAAACPTEAIRDAGQPSMAIDLGRCLFCPECTRACPEGALRFGRDFRLAARTREGLTVSGDAPLLPEGAAAAVRAVLGRALRLRQVSAGAATAARRS
jgi:formate hydrogenlyase subunit 6/NADH:ubiquinone oxidoreductase subunit I